MEVKYKLCNKCGFSYISQGLQIGSENFCSLTCFPSCNGCFSLKDVVLYCEKNEKYYCISCEKKRCIYCNMYKVSSKCINKCD